MIIYGLMNLMLIDMNARVCRKQKILKSLLMWKISSVCFVKWYERMTPKVKATALFLCFVKSVTKCVHLINWRNTTNNVSKIGKAFRVLVQPPKMEGSTSFPVLENPSESFKQRERRWPLHFFEFCNGRSPLWSHGKRFRDLEDRRWPFKMMRNMWSWTWPTKLIMYHLIVFLKKLVKIENIVSRTFSIQLVILLPF